RVWWVGAGSTPTRSTTPAMPSLSRLKSMRRYFWREPPPWWRVVMRPKWLRAPVLFWCAVRDSSGPPRCRCERSTLMTARCPGVLGLYLMRAMLRPLGLGAGFVVDRLAGLQAHVGFLPVLRAPDRAAELARLARLVHDLHALHLDVEHQLDRLLDVRLGRLAAHPEGVLVVVLHRERGLLGDVRGDQHAPPLVAVHCRRCSSSFTAPTVISPLS